jgi:hypothetical protein
LHDLLFKFDQLSGGFQCPVIIALENKFVDRFDDFYRTGRGRNEITRQFPVELMMRAQAFAVHVHELDDEIDPVGRAVGILVAENVLMPQDRHIVVHHELGPARAVGDHGAADDQAFMRFQGNFQRHGIFLP